MLNQDLIDRLYTRANIRLQIKGRKSVIEDKPDKLAALLIEAALALEEANCEYNNLRELYELSNKENELIRSEMGIVMAQGHVQSRLKNTYLNQLLDLNRSISEGKVIE